MKSKKGIVLSETLRIIIAVACIFLLIYLAVGLYGIFTRSSELEQAKATLEGIIGKMGVLGENQELKYVIVNPREWRIVFFQDNNYKNLCICPFDLPDKQKETCIKQGVCQVLSNNITMYSCYFDKDIISEDLSCLSLKQLPISLTITRNSEGYVFLSSLDSSLYEIAKEINLIESTGGVSPSMSNLEEAAKKDFQSTNGLTTAEIITEFIQSNNNENKESNMILHLTNYISKNLGENQGVSWAIEIKKGEQDFYYFRKWGAPDFHIKSDSTLVGLFLLKQQEIDTLNVEGQNYRVILSFFTSDASQAAGA
ncbi:hypothetical protein FJZ17_03610 [Candidatus Pacearchaeota archaeon]|nr:hypothetical protein [Candidatus Pacearchaeota archaeon]